MNRSLAILLLLTLSFSLSRSLAQSSDNEDHVVKIDPAYVRSYRSGQVIVKFKDDSDISVRRHAPGRFQINANRVKAVNDRLGVSDMEQLMPVGGRKVMRRSPLLRSAITGKLIEDRDLSKLYLVKFDAKRTPDVHSAIEAFQELEEVEFAEPNYLVFALGTPASKPFDGRTAETDNHVMSANSATVPAVTINDPYYISQWGPAGISLPALWRVSGPNVLGHRPVVAILDTGVDINHPDLKDNIWTNEAELNGLTGEDDDMNGYVDDLHGWDCVNQTGRIGDYHGHGTHCAGIAAAVAGNGKGIVGANPDALIMPVTVLQSDGGGDVGTIIKGLEYCLTHQVDVISMSYGGYGNTLAEEMALSKCYHYSVLVAAAGNDGIDPTNIHNCHKSISGLASPMFPGAYTFVLGTQAGQPYDPYSNNHCITTGLGYNPWRADWSNFDCDGSFYSEFDEEKLFNYEIMAPGVRIMSTYPNGRYIYMNGTSMACPLAAGAISRLISLREYSSKELLFADLIYTRQEHEYYGDTIIGSIDIAKAYQVTEAQRKPTLWVVNYEIEDSINGDGDGRFDAGEEVALYPILRNTWGQAENIRCSISVRDNEDPTIIEVTENNVDFGKPLSTYGKELSLNPIRFKIREDCVDGRRIELRITATCSNGTGKTIHQDITITAENGEELEGILAKNTTLEAGKHYIITKSIAIPNGITLSIQPGTTIKFHDNALIKVAERGRIRAIGTPDQPIIFTKGDLAGGWIPGMTFNTLCQFEYCQFIGLSTAYWSLITGGRFTDCIFKDCNFGHHGMTGITTTRCNIIYNTGDMGYEFGNTHTNTNIIGNISTSLYPVCEHGYWHWYRTKWEEVNACNLYGNFSNYLERYADIACVSEEPTVVYYDYPSYLGSAKQEIAGKGIMDYYNEANNDVLYTSFAGVDLKNMLTQPNADAHGIVWKILVDGIDAQDDYEQLIPLGVGRHKVEVYFNRPMDTSINPWVSMGVRPPYTQTFIDEDPSWNDDGTVYTAYITLTAKSAFDGINRFYVADAQDLDHFVIPTERYRFNVPVSAAGSKSLGFTAEPGLGKVGLSWDGVSATEVEDLIGYNLYRYTLGADNQPQDTTLVNSELIDAFDIVNDTVRVVREELAYTDYDVTPGTTYYYYYKVQRSTLDTTDPSRTIAATPLTATRGDANGSMDVTVADVVTEIAYLTDQKPQPFIFEAADVNADQVINILDVVGTINIIIPPTSQPGAQSFSSATFTIEDGMLYVDSPVRLAGLQVVLEGITSTQSTEVLEKMECVGTLLNGANSCQFLCYSLSGATIPAGRHAVLRVGEAGLKDIVLSDTHGHEVLASYEQPTVIEQMSEKPVNAASQEHQLFDLTGRKVIAPSRGIYIINGKKVCF